MTAASPMFAAEMYSPSSGGSGGASGGSSSGDGWIPQFLVLYDGFAIDPLAAFAYSGSDENVHRHYSVTQTGTSSDADGVSYSTATVYDVDLTMDATVNADGTWTYTEDVISSYTLTVTAAGAASPESSGSGTLDYDFSASGSATLSHFSYTGHGTDTESGSTTTTSSSTDGSGFTTTETVNERWKDSDTYSAAITNTTDLAISAASGTALENEGATATTSSSGAYSRTIEGGMVNGTTSGSSVQHNNLHASWTISRAADGTVTAIGSGSAHEDAGDNESYQGGGGFSVTSSGSDGYTETNAGTVTENGNSASSVWETVGYHIATNGAAWNQTSGSGGTHDSGAHHYHESGNGTYSYPIEGGTVSGTTKSSGDEHGSYGFTTKSEFTAGAWSNTGSGSGNETSASQNSYSGKGEYTITSSSGNGYTETISGNVSESGSSDDYAHEAAGYTLATDGSTWNQTGGSGSTHASSDDDYSYSGSGTYSRPVEGGTVNGTIKESGGNSAGYHEHTKSTWVASAWNTTGSASDAAASDDQSKYDGSGKYSVSSTGASGYIETISGTIKETGASSDSEYQGADYTLTASGSWAQTSGSGYTNEKANDHESSSGSGPYSYQVEGGGVNGTVKESAYDDFNNAYGTISAFINGQWQTVGGGHETFANGDTSSNAGGGTYSSTNFGSDGYVEHLSGTITEGGHSSQSFKETDGYTLNASGSWVQSTGSGKSSDSEDNDESYDGGGGYSYLVAGGIVHGALSESGYADDAAHYSSNSTYKNGAWITEGSGSSMVHSGDFDSYQGGASYTRKDSGSGGYTETITGTITEFGSASEVYYQRKEYEPGSASGTWNQVSGSGYTSNRSANNNSYVGAGTYVDPAASTTGTVNESGHNNNTSKFSTDSSYAKGAWTTTGTGKQTFSSGDNGSYKGSGKTTVPVSASGSSSGGTIAATLTEYGSSGFAVDETDGYTLNTAGKWVQSTGNANTTRSSGQGQALAASGSYEHAAASGTIDGTTHVKMGWGVTGVSTVYGTYSGGEWDYTGNRTIVNTAFNDGSYSGSGSFKDKGTGFSSAADSISGNMYEDGLSDGAFKETDYFKFVMAPPASGTASGSGSASSGHWDQSSGLRIYSTTIENNASYSGSGDASHTVPGGEASGTLDEGGNNDASSVMTRYVKYQGGTWASSSGSATKSTSSGTHWSFEGSGSYSAAALIWPGTVSETLHGTVSESAGSATSTAHTDDYELDVADDTWNLTQATRATTNVSHTSTAYDGSGSYSDPQIGGSVSGTVNQDGHYGSSADFSTHSTASASGGPWKTTGTGSVTVKSGQYLSWSGSGPYAYQSGGAVVNGTITQHGHSSQSSTVTLGLDAQNTGWTVTSGSGKTSDTWSDDYSLSGGGGYLYYIDGGTMKGTLTENGHDNQSYDYATKSNYKNGAWSTTGSGTETSSTGLGMTFSGSGDWSYEVPGGTVKGTAKESGASDVSETQTENFTLNASGSWAQTGGSGKTNDSAGAKRSYQGSGSYHALVYDVPVSGTVTDNGSETSNYNYTTHSNYSGGAWHTTGSGGSSDYGNTQHAYTGHGHISSSTSASGVSTQFKAWVIEGGADNGQWNYQTKAKYAGSGWSESGSGTASASSSASCLYHDLAVTTVNQHSSGPDGSSRDNSTTTVTHLVKTVGNDGYIDHFNLLNGGWSMSSHAAWGADSEDRTYTYADNGSASSISYEGDYSGGNGSRYVDWSKVNDSHAEGDKTGQMWSTLTRYSSGGRTVTTGTASGGEQAYGTDDHNDSNGEEHDERTTSPGYAYSGMSATSNYEITHDQYKDRATWSEKEASDGSVSTSGSASFHVSGSYNVGGQSHWAWTETTGGTGSGSGSASTTSSNGGGAWSSGGSYSTSVDYWGFYQGAEGPYYNASAGSVYFGSGEGWTGPGSPSDTGSGSGGGYLDVGSGASDAEPGPPGGPLAGTGCGPTVQAVDEAPVTDAYEPENLAALAGCEGAVQSVADMAEGQAKAPPAAQAPGQVAQEKNAAQAKAAQGQGFFNVRKQPDVYGGEGIPFSAGNGPVSVVGIVGNGVTPPKPETGGFNPGGGKDISGFAALVRQARGLVTEHGDRLVQVEAPGVEGGKHPQIYGSSDGIAVGGSAMFPSKSAEEIAREQYRLIQDTVGDGTGLKPDEEYRLLLMGHSWGGDKAVEVANLLAQALRADPDLAPLYERDKIQIHLVTLDAIGQRKDFPPGDKASERVVWSNVRVASWLNISQTGDTGLPPFPAMKGGDFPGSLDHNLTMETLAKLYKGKPTTGLHATVPFYARSPVTKHLYPSKP